MHLEHERGSSRSGGDGSGDGNVWYQSNTQINLQHTHEIKKKQ